MLRVSNSRPTPC